MMESYVKVSTCASVVQRTNQISNSNQPDRSLVKKLIQLEPNDWPEFQEQPKCFKKNPKLNKKNLPQKPIQLDK